MRYLLALLLLVTPLQAQTVSTEVVIEGRRYRLDVTPLDPPPPPPSPGPRAPTDLAPDNISSARIDLTWKDNSADETGFSLWRRQGTGDWLRLALLSPGTGRFSDWSVTAGATYTYRVQAVNEAGVSAFSNEITVTAQSQNPPPGAVAPAVVGALWTSPGARPETGETVTLRGMGFGEPGKLQVDFAEYPYERWGETEIVFRWPLLEPPPPPTVSVRRRDGQWYSSVLKRAE